MESADKTLEDAARNLRANQWQVFRHIQLPYLMPAIVGGGAFAFLSSFDNLPVSLFTSPPLDPPLPIYIFRIMLYKIDPMIAAVATIQILITFIVMVVAARSVGPLQLLGGDQVVRGRAAANLGGQ
jgi:putative spermidine/putrescine transport system permease protein